jgi:3-oxoadipate enol-lactonase
MTNLVSLKIAGQAAVLPLTPERFATLSRLGRHDVANLLAPVASRLQEMKLWHEIAGDGPIVTLIHPGVCDSRVWNPQWSTFPLKHTTIRCDLRGFGRTPLPAESFSHARDVVDLLDQLLDQLNVGPTALVGASLGGRVALEVALARPDLVDRLVLVGASIPGFGWSEDVIRFGDEEDAALNAGDIEAAVQTNLRMWIDGPNRSSDSVDPAIRNFIENMQRHAFELQLPVWEEGDEELLVPDMGDRFVEISVPTLVLVGSEDIADMRTIADDLASSIPGALKAEIGGAAHIPSIEKPDEFDRLVLDFLDRQG